MRRERNRAESTINGSRGCLGVVLAFVVSLQQLQPHHENVPMKPSLIVRATAALLCTLLIGPALAQTSVLRDADQRQRQQKAAADAEAISAAVANFVVIAPGVVKDTRTGSEWMRCSIGQDWNEKKKTCDGDANKYNFQGAQDIASKLNNLGGFQGKTNWRVPTVRGLQNLRACSAGFESKAIDIQDGGTVFPRNCNENSLRTTIALTVFPGATSSETYWTTSPYVGDVRYAWIVEFTWGGVGYNNRYDSNYVRLMR